jgi:hypothetical protein
VQLHRVYASSLSMLCEALDGARNYLALRLKLTRLPSAGSSASFARMRWSARGGICVG